MAIATRLWFCIKGEQAIEIELNVELPVGSKNEGFLYIPTTEGFLIFGFALLLAGKP